MAWFFFFFLVFSKYGLVFIFLCYFSAPRAQIKGYRWDKNESNFCHTVFSCMEASIGHVDLRELGDRLLQLKPEWKMADQEARAAFNNSTANNSNMR